MLLHVVLAKLLVVPNQKLGIEYPWYFLNKNNISVK